MSKELSKLVEDLNQRRLTRRQFIVRAAALGLSVGAIGSILAACGQEGATQPTATTAPAAAATTAPAAATTAPTTAPSGEATKPAGTTAKTPNNGSDWRMAIIHISPATEGGWDPNHTRGYTAMAEKLGWKTTVAESVDYSRAAEVMRGYGSDGYDAIVVTSGGYGDVLLEVAPEFPKSWFVMVSDLESTKGIPNVAGFRIMMAEIGYMVGTFAALASKTPTVGIDSGTPIYSVNKMIAGIIEGIKAVNKDYKLQVNYAGTWNDVPKVKESTLALIDKGVTAVINIHAGAERGVFEAAKEKGVMATSYYTDRGDEYPGVVGGGPAWDTPTVYTNLAQMIMDGKLESKVYTSTVGNGEIGVLPSHNLLPADKEAQLQQVISDIKSGKLTIADYPAYQPEGEAPKE